MEHKKLTLNKETIANLNAVEMSRIYGGEYNVDVVDSSDCQIYVLDPVYVYGSTTCYGGQVMVPTWVIGAAGGLAQVNNYLGNTYGAVITSVIVATTNIANGVGGVPVNNNTQDTWLTNYTSP